jgi:hypothetical protein
MELDLAPLRRAHERFVNGDSADDIISELQMLFGLDFVTAMAALSAAVLLHDRGLAIPEERTVVLG